MVVIKQKNLKDLPLHDICPEQGEASIQGRNNHLGDVVVRVGPQQTHHLTLGVLSLEYFLGRTDGVEEWSTRLTVDNDIGYPVATWRY